MNCYLCPTHLPVPFIHDPRDLYLLSPHGCLLSWFSDTSTISEKQHSFFFLSPSTLCKSLSSYIGSHTSQDTLCSSADHTRIWKRTKREREKLKVNMTPNNISQSTRGFCILYSSTYRNYETCIACWYLFDCFNCSTAEITERQVHPKWEGTIQVSLTFIVFFSN